MAIRCYVGWLLHMGAIVGAARFLGTLVDQVVRILHRSKLALDGGCPINPVAPVTPPSAGKPAPTGNKFT
ncbi:hypothetical protein D3C73_1503010 [compost metagenome]